MKKIVSLLTVLLMYSCEYVYIEDSSYKTIENEYFIIEEEFIKLESDIALRIVVDDTELFIKLSTIKESLRELENQIFELENEKEEVLNNLSSKIESLDIRLNQFKEERLIESDIVYRVYEFFHESKTHSEIIEEALAYTNLLKERVLIFDTIDWNIDRAIQLSSNTTVIVDGVIIKQNNYVFDNVFRGDNLVLDKQDPNGFPTEIRNLENIKVLGYTGAEIIGCDINQTIYNSFLNETQELVGDFYGWRTLQVSFSNCTNLEISGFKFSQTRSWCVSIDLSSDIKIHDLEINSDVKNGDGVDIREGCSYFEVYNISGVTSDDTVAVTAISSLVDYENTKFMFPIVPTSKIIEEDQTIDGGVYNGSIYNIKKSGDHHAVILFTSGGREINNIIISDINEESVSVRNALVRIYKDSEYIDNDISDVRITNVKGLSYFEKAAVYCDAKVDNLWINNVSSNDGKTVLLEYEEGAVVTNSNQ